MTDRASAGRKDCSECGHFKRIDRDWWYSFAKKFGWRLVGFSGLDTATFQTHGTKLLRLDYEEAKALLREPL